ncbi:hypothetical protein DZ860_06610 [Vibrio sinensis]|uniref:Lipoprotein n=1 Tax=Vibrio sinensis TaxID=2302434 RepID=A0A3A6QJR0_9VIBR|nr:hypothetical protein [Vibrio sinensis]RJX72825.1 hypothetical protein DZ860_06610 [Vibrio sinensis]
MNKLLCLLPAALLLAGCSGANVTSQLRALDTNSPEKVLRCESFSTGSSSVNETLEQYDGWAMVYASEYTTDNKTTTEMTMCFEKDAK